MQPNNETLQEFIRLYEQVFHKRLSEEEAREIWVRVMNLYLLLYGPEPDDFRTTNEVARDAPVFRVAAQEHRNHLS